MKHTKIEWTETTWNPTTGCTNLNNGVVKIKRLQENFCRERYINKLLSTLIEKNPLNYSI